MGCQQRFFVTCKAGELVEIIRGCVLRAPNVGERIAARPSVSPIPLSRLESDLRALLPKVPLTLVVVNQEELHSLDNLSEMTRSDDGYALALRLATEASEPFDRAATRVWTLLEAGKKANGLKRILPRYESSLGGSWLSCVGTADLQPLDFLSGTFTLPGENNAAVVLTVTTRPFHGMGEPRAGC